MRHEYNGMNKAFLYMWEWEEVGAYEGTSRQGPERGIQGAMEDEGVWKSAGAWGDARA